MSSCPQRCYPHNKRPPPQGRAFAASFRRPAGLLRLRARIDLSPTAAHICAAGRNLPGHPPRRYAARLFPPGDLLKMQMQYIRFPGESKEAPPRKSRGKSASHSGLPPGKGALRAFPPLRIPYPARSRFHFHWYPLPGSPPDPYPGRAAPGAAGRPHRRTRQPARPPPELPAL